MSIRDSYMDRVIIISGGQVNEKVPFHYVISNAVSGHSNDVPAGGSG